MARFRKRPVEIEAFQYRGLPHVDRDAPRWFSEALLNRKVVAYPEYLEIVTLEGVMTAYATDWIIKGVKGELYPCKPDIFAATYEPVEGP
jgi:hypothetical protein